MFNKLFSENRDVRETMWNKIRAGQATDNNIKTTHVFCVLDTKAHSEYVILIFFPPMTMMIWRRSHSVTFIACIIYVYFSLVN